MGHGIASAVVDAVRAIGRATREDVIQYLYDQDCSYSVGAVDRAICGLVREHRLQVETLSDAPTCETCVLVIAE